MNLANWLLQSARIRPEAPALLLGSEVVADYRGFLGRVRARAGQLSAQGITPGARVLIYAANTPEYLVALYAIWWIGAVAVPVNRKLHPAEAAWIAENAGASLMLTDQPGIWSGPEAGLTEDLAAPEAPPAPLSLPGDTLAWLFYTSGTTGRPKGVMLSHDNLVQMSLNFLADVEPLTPSQRMLYAAPASHGAGLYALPAVRAGAAHVFPVSKGFDPAEIMGLAPTLGGLVFFAAPTMVKRLILAAEPLGYKGEGIHSIIYGGGPMYLADIEAALKAFGPRFAQIYGQGECPMTISVLPRALVADQGPAAARRRASVGHAQAGVEIAIRGAGGEALAAGETGEITVRGPLVMQGYWQNPEASAAAIKDGWLWTGDVGHLDEEGFLHLTDRSKDVIISGGTNIYPREVEEVLLEHPQLREVSVIGAPDDDWGEVVLACVVAPGLDEAELNAFFRARSAAFKAPKRYLFLEELPKNAYGKVLKTELRERAKSGA